MGAQMEALKEKQAVNKPIYNHDTGFKDEPELVQPNDLMIFEGLHPIYDEKAREQLDLSIYIDIVNEVKFAWKVQRDVAERGWTEQQVKEDIEKRLPDFSEYVDPQKTESDIILRYEPSDKGLPGLKVKLIQVRAVRPLPDYKGHAGYQHGFQMVQLVGDELKLKDATLKSYIEPWGGYPFAEVLEMDGVLDKDNMEAELKMIEDKLAGLQTTSATELTDSMMALKDSPGSLDGTGVFQNVIALQLRHMFENQEDHSFRKAAKRVGIDLATEVEKSAPPGETFDTDQQKLSVLDVIRGMLDDKTAESQIEMRSKDAAPGESWD
jgi:phosphoribulokinase